MRTDDISWGPPPEGVAGPYIPIISAVGTGAFEVVVLSETIIGVETHWVDQRTQPCTKGTGSCICLREPVRCTWKGYLGVWEPRHDRLLLLELTVDAVRHANVPLGPDSPSLRGMVARVRRTSRAKRAPVRVAFRAGDHPIETLRPEPNVRGALLRIWCGRSRQEAGFDVEEG